MKKLSINIIAIALFVFVTGCSQHDQQLSTGQDGEARPSRPATNEEIITARDELIDLSTGPSPALSSREADTNKQPVHSNVIHKQAMQPPAAILARESALPDTFSYLRQERALVPGSIRLANEPVNRENYVHYEDNGTRLVTEFPVSTFSIDVDTGSYSNVRRLLQSGSLPVQDAVRLEELINYFTYDYKLNAELDSPFVMYKEIAPSPWNKNTYLLHIGIKGYDIPGENLPPANLVFLIDVSGSMQSSKKLELLKSSLGLLGRQLRSEDRVSIVVYAGASGIVLEPTAGNEKGKIISAIDRLTAGGSTNGASGIRLAYSLAEQAYIHNGINRVLLATDGDFNVGIVNIEQLKNLIEEKRKSGIALTTLGFGTGNYNDHLMEQLADTGNGNYAYIDNLNEAQKVLIDEMSATMLTIARDVKIQIEFNPALVSEYRLLGYENRILRREDFNNDKIDAGDIGAGHTVTALYEITMTDNPIQRIEPLRYQAAEVSRSKSDEIAHLRLRYKKPGEPDSKLLQWPIRKSEVISSVDYSSNAFRFSSAVAAFAQLLRGGKYMESFTYDDILQLGRQARGEDPYGYRGEFLQLVNLAKSISQPEQHARKIN